MSQPAPCGVPAVNDAQSVKAAQPFLGRTLADAMSQGYDNFSLLRFLAAALVIFGHSWATAKNPSGVTDWIGQQTLIFSGTVAVNIFFWVSGFLITMSYIRRPQFVPFVLARVLRIFPALIVCVLLTALVLGSVCTTLPFAEYFKHPGVWHYIHGSSFLHDVQWYLPGVFESNNHKGVVNGSLWTLNGELRMYLFVVLLGSFGLLANATRFGWMLATLIAIVLFLPSIHLVKGEFIGLSAFFAFGAFCYVHRAAIPVSGYLVLAIAFLTLCLRGQPGYFLMLSAFTAYAALWFSYGPRLPSLEKYGDYSYGLYLYGFPIQQLVAYLQPELGPLRSLLLSFPLTLVLAIPSWHFVEKPMLRFKSKPKRSALENNWYRPAN
jgi:peptidoglycan/LPS O-acetylase OafA/YrhL